MKQKFIIFGGTVLLLACFILLISLSLFTKSMHQSSPIPTPVIPSPTLIPTQIIPSPTPTLSQTDVMISTINNRPTLSASDAAVKNKILARIGNASATLLTTTDYRIDYVQTPDVFQVEITTNNIASAKNGAIQWFESQGISQQGICQLPLTFYLNFAILQQLKTANQPFNPLPDFCHNETS